MGMRHTIIATSPLDTSIKFRLNYRTNRATVVDNGQTYRSSLNEAVEYLHRLVESGWTAT